MRCIVTGGCGFIGSHLTERLLAEGHEVVIVDNLATGRRENLGAVQHHPRLRVHIGNVAEPEECADAFQGADWVFHLAGLADFVPSIERPWDYFHANATGTVGALEMARAVGARRFVYTASASCYGLPERIPTPEDAAFRPAVPYALTKLLGEQCAFHWAQTYGLPVVSLRLFNVYGPRARRDGAYGSVFSVFLAQKVQGKPYTVVGDGRQKRDFVHVTDVAAAFVKAAQSQQTGVAYNVGSGEEHTVLEIVDLLGGPFVTIPKRPGEAERSCADTTRIRRELGWAPRMKFEDGVRDLLARVEDWRQEPIWTREAMAETRRAWCHIRSHLDKA